MRILSRAGFLAMPPNTVYAEGPKWAFGEWAIKGETHGNDWYYDALDTGAILSRSSEDRIDQIEKSAASPIRSIPMDFHYTGRDGCYQADHWYAVLEPQDIRALIARLEECL